MMRAVPSIRPNKKALIFVVTCPKDRRHPNWFCQRAATLYSFIDYIVCGQLVLRPKLPGMRPSISQ